MRCVPHGLDIILLTIAILKMKAVEREVNAVASVATGP